MKEEKKSHEKDKRLVSWLSSLRESKRKIRRRRRRREVIEIPNDDVLEEIMVRLPVKTLIQSQIVSKYWRRMITSNSFKERYMLHRKTKEPKFLNLSCDKDWDVPNIALKTMGLEWSSTCLVEEEEKEDHIIIASDEHEEEELVVSCSLDGLVCLYGRKNLKRAITIINPVTRWSQRLPLAKIQLEHSLDKYKVEFSYPGFGKDCVTATYKLVWLHNINHNNNNTSSCEVFDFDAKKWRQVVPPPPHHRIKHNQAPTFANGWLYWFIQEKTKLVAFDFHMEIFRIVPNPIIETSSSSLSSLDMCMESLDDDRCLVWISETNGDGMQHVWRLTNHNTGGALLKMYKMYSFDLKKISSTWFESHRSSPLQLLAISKNGDKVMLEEPGSRNLLLFQPLNPTSICNRMFSFCALSLIDGALVPYFPSLASPL